MLKETSKLNTKKSIRTRERLLQNAFNLFSKKGFNQTSMRDLAKKSEISLGLAYYYYPSKESLVLAFYEKCLSEFEDSVKNVFSNSTSFKTRLKRTLAQKLLELKPYRHLLMALTNKVLDPRSEVSPFSSKTSIIRKRVIIIFEELVKTSDLKTNKNIKERLPLILWLMHMGIIYYWLNDQSNNFTKTARLIDKTIDIFCALLKLANLPMMGLVIKPFTDIYDLLIQDYVPN